MQKPTLYVIGDSTVSSFNDPYYYPRYGYGTQLGCYIKNIPIVNLALSGRSSKSFIQEKNYEILKNSLQPNDYLMIGFGHNDEKSDDPLRFTDARKALDNPASFSYFLYEYYIKLALERQAIPILCTPICRVDFNNDYTKNSAHITATGDYRLAICKLAEEKNLTVLDLTEATHQQYVKLGSKEAVSFHATIAGIYAADGKTILPDVKTVDATHLNILGAKNVAYHIARLLKASNCSLKEFVVDLPTPPVKELDLLPNPSYKVRVYRSPNLKEYMPVSQFSTKTKGYYGTAFGDCGGIPDEVSHGYQAKEVENGVFHVGQDSSSSKGKIALSNDGLAFVFRQISIKDNFAIAAHAKVLKTANVKQAGFGLMLRDDVYLHQNASTEIITSNYLAAGLLTTDTTMSPIFYREQSELHKEEPVLEGIYSLLDEADFVIERVGQSMTMKVSYKGILYEKTYVDFDLLAVDHSYMYVGMFATRGTIAEFSDVTFEITGVSQGA